MRRDLDLPARRLVEGSVADVEPRCALARLEIGDPGRRRFPAWSANDEGDGAQDLHAAEADVAELAGLEIEAERALREALDRRGRLLGAVEDRCLRCVSRHRLLPSPPIALTAIDCPKNTIFAPAEISRRARFSRNWRCAGRLTGMVDITPRFHASLSVPEGTDGQRHCPARGDRCGPVLMTIRETPCDMKLRIR